MIGQQIESSRVRKIDGHEDWVPSRHNAQKLQEKRRCWDIFRFRCPSLEILKAFGNVVESISLGSRSMSERVDKRDCEIFYLRDSRRSAWRIVFRLEQVNCRKEAIFLAMYRK